MKEGLLSRDAEKARASRRAHYHRNKEKYVAAARAHDVKVAQQVRAFIVGYLALHPCVDCGLSDPVVLEFDHRRPDDKLFSVGTAVHRKLSLRSVIAEIEKCDVRCANCHRRKTATERGWYRAALTPELLEGTLRP